MTRRRRSSSEDTVASAKKGDVGARMRLVQQIKDSWQRGTIPDATREIIQHPELLRKSVVLDLAYEEFCLREQSGESITIAAFCDKFPDFRSSVRRRLEVHQVFGGVDECSEDVWPMPSQELCGFRLIEEIGRGAIGRVYLANEVSMGNRQVVVKVSQEGDEEAVIHGPLQHTNVVPAYSIQIDEVSGLTVICMPYFGLTTFEDVLDKLNNLVTRPTRGTVFADAIRCRNAKVGENESKGLCLLNRRPFVDCLLSQFAQVADALAYLHSQGICHLDLKPSNVLLANDGRPMLLDFNLSSKASQNLRRIGGTLPYMAPEQVQAMIDEDGGAVDWRADVFSVGVMLFEILTGVSPFGSVSRDASIKRVGLELLERQKAGTTFQRSGPSARIVPL